VTEPFFVASPSSFYFNWFWGAIMLAAVRKGDTKELAELMRQDPGFKVNQQP